MRIIETTEEARKIVALLPSSLQAVAPPWHDVATGFDFRCDLLYFDTILPINLKWLPKILRRFGDEKCFIFNHGSLLQGGLKNGSDIAIEISAACDPSQIERELGNEGESHHRYLSVFYLVGDFGVISPEREWLLFARADDHALFASKNEQLYSDFNECWWAHSVENRRSR